METNRWCQTCGEVIVLKNKFGRDRVHAMYCSSSCAAKMNGILSPKRGKTVRYPVERDSNGFYVNCVQCSGPRGSEHNRVFCSSDCRDSFWDYEISLRSGRTAKKTGKCVTCGTAIQSTSTWCRLCFSSALRSPIANKCVDCGTDIKRYSTRCTSCHHETMRGITPKRGGNIGAKKNQCIDCGKEIGRTSKRCYDCYHEYRRDRSLDLWLNGASSFSSPNPCILPVGIRKYLLEESEYACSKCQFNTMHEDGSCILEINHIDGDPTNHIRHNLEVLCPNCHALTPNFRSRNKGKGRLSRSKA